MELVIEISADGGVKALHTDKFDLSFLGAKKVRRQTEIVFDDGAQQWYVQYLCDDPEEEGPTVSGFSEYEQARGFEVKWVNACRLKSINPASPQGCLEAAAILREGADWIPSTRITAPALYREAMQSIAKGW